MTHGQFLNEIILVWIQSFLFPKLVTLPRLRNPILATIYISLSANATKKDMNPPPFQLWLKQPVVFLPFLNIYDLNLSFFLSFCAGLIFFLSFCVKTWWFFLNSKRIVVQRISGTLNCYQFIQKGWLFLHKPSPPWKNHLCKQSSGSSSEVPTHHDRREDIFPYFVRAMPRK